MRRGRGVSLIFTLCWNVGWASDLSGIIRVALIRESMVRGIMARLNI